jgi:hypothetical protein
MCKWLDTQTKEILQGVPPTKLAPDDVATFSLIMLEDGKDPLRTTRALFRLAEQIDRPSLLSPGPLFPVVIVGGITVEDALFGQFELISCDAISVFIRDEVVSEGLEEYLGDLYDDLRHSREFEVVSVDILSVPNGADGDRFLDQFMGIDTNELTHRMTAIPSRTKVARKKARIMSHWAGKMGAVVAFDDA